jgi:hypothetical protein
MNLKTERKTGPPKSTPDQIKNIGCRRMRWQSEGNWHWSIVFTDRMSELIPIFINPMGNFCTRHLTNFGNNLNAQGPNGPNE